MARNIKQEPQENLSLQSIADIYDQINTEMQKNQNLQESNARLRKDLEEINQKIVATKSAKISESQPSFSQLENLLIPGQNGQLSNSENMDVENSSYLYNLPENEEIRMLENQYIEDVKKFKLQMRELFSNFSG
ncbi:unnamed protein product [Blepharisma stoltei]|uniref:Uncharacterized protein n=1 Tax=Blepharisma stoltei TaxID=1481888 RepID=A0AAU9K8R3_9CILI|nr:unnamed protein product [Blepharisma stoltei]